MTNKIETPWGPIGYITLKRTYSRRLKENDPSSPTEEFSDIVNRIVKACDKQLKVGFTEKEEARLQEILLGLKGTVAGRFLWQLGTKTVDRLGLLSLQNCAFTVVNEPIKPFTWTMDALMLGSGVGYNIQREYVYELPRAKKVKIIRQETNDADFIVPDSREGWVELLRRTLEAHFVTGNGFSYSTVCVRGKGIPIKGFGGSSSGPEELCDGITDISKVINARAGKKLRPIDCLDIMNIIGRVVVSGNVRRSAQIAIGDMDDLQFLNAKRWDLGNIPNWRAMSNNSVVCNDFSLLPDQFWQGYQGNGEPYGLINLNLARSIGRTGETQYPDPEVCGFNPCVTGDTEILTKNGHERIDSLVGQKIEVWNGFEWSEVEPKITGRNQELMTVSLSDGRHLTCTKYHKFYIARGYTGQHDIVEAKDLESGMKLIKHSFPVIEHGPELKNAYTQGFVAAEGTEGDNQVWVYEPKYTCLNRLNENTESVGNDYGGRKYIIFKEPMLSKTFIPHKYNLKSKLDWLSGLFDGDGTELKEGGLQLVSIDKSFLLGVQKLLTTVGVQSKIVPGRPEGMRPCPDGNGGYKNFHCQESYRICIGSTQMQYLKKIGLKCERMSFNKNPQRDASQFVTVVDVTESGVADIVYCFNEPKRHLGVFNGVITGQCAEQGLAPYETCCLAETYLPNIESYKELCEVLTFLYRINKHSLDLPCHMPETEAIVHKNMRMGIGITGYLQATEEQKKWLKKAYVYLREYDKKYSKEKGFPESIKLTTVKPSGTLSLLAGVTSGAHPGYSQYYLRRIRMSSNIPLVQTCRQKGYNVEFQRNFDGTEDKGTVVVSFPCKFPEGTVLAKDMTAIDQLEVVKRMQAEWSDNAVSVTIYYKKEELEEIKKWLSVNYNNNLKTVSFLLHNDHGFDQAPLEEITKEQYEEMVSKCEPISSIESLDEKSVTGVDECQNGICPIK